MKQIDYDKKIALCKKLGSEKFKNVVNKVQKIKFKVLKKVFPNYIEKFDKRIDKALNKELKKVHTEEERKLLIREAQRQKMAIRKEDYLEENRNYRMDENNPFAMIEYLKWNRDVHRKGLLANGISAVAIGLVGIHFPIVLPLLAVEAVDAFLNFQCINLQNQNIYRYEKDKQRIDKIYERKISKNKEKYGKAGEVFERTLSKTEAKLPKPKEYTDKAITLEEYLQMIDLAIDERKSRGQTEGLETLNNKREQVLERINKRKINIESKSLGGKVK